MLKDSEPLQDRRQPAREKGDREPKEWDMRRFTQFEHERGDTAGWRFDAGWFTRSGGLVWAWFSREVEDGTTIEIE